MQKIPKKYEPNPHPNPLKIFDCKIWKIHLFLNPEMVQDVKISSKIFETHKNKLFNPERFMCKI